MINKNSSYIIFRVLFVIFLVSNIVSLHYPFNVNLIPSIHVSDIPFLRFFLVLFLGLLIIPAGIYMDILKDKKLNKIPVILIILLLAGYISAYFSEHQQVAFNVCNRISFYLVILIICIAASVYFENASGFILKAFVYVNTLVIAGSLLDFYIPDFHSLLVMYFDRPEAKHSYIQIGAEKIMRPMGFVTDSNLTAFSVSFAMMLLLLNHSEFNKMYRYMFYVSGSYILGMLASRGSLILCFVCITAFLAFKITERKEILIFIFLFIVFQAVTPQTYGRILSYYDNEKMEEEYNIGRPVIWSAAFEVFLDNPVKGAGPGVFFELSRERIRKILKETTDINIDNPDLPEYHQVDRVNPHNIFLVMLSETGLTGFTLFILLIAVIAVSLYREKKFAALLFLAVILFVSALSNFAPYYKYYLAVVIVYYSVSGNNMRIKTNTGGKIRESKNILIFKLCCLGDTVFMTPAIKAIRRQYPDSKIIFAHAAWVKQLLYYIPDINGEILFENVYGSNILKKFAGTVKFILKTRSYKFDMVLYGHRSSVFAFILWLCGIKKRCGFKGTRFLTHKAKFNKDIPEFYRYLEILSECGFSTDGLFPVLKKPLRETVRKSIHTEPDSVLLGIFPMGGLNPGTEMDIKRWDLGNYFRLIHMLNKKYPEIKIILFEGKHATEKISIPDGTGALKKVINNDIISCCDYFISGDTGSLHIAAAMDIPTLSLFGPSDPRLLAPKNNPVSGTRHLNIWMKPDCSPCYETDSAIDKSNSKFWRSNEFICHTGTHVCMKSILPEEVLDKFSELMAVNYLK